MDGLSPPSGTTAPRGAPTLVPLPQGELDGGPPRASTGLPAQVLERRHVRSATVCLWPRSVWRQGMAVMLIARFDGDVGQLRQAYDRAHALIMSRGGGPGAGGLGHHAASGARALSIMGLGGWGGGVGRRWAGGDLEAV